ncbi:MAG: hypothetical protein R3B84_08210 [Zavarzinella sp.]
MPKKIAAIITEYRRHSHADVIIGKILEGPNYDGKNLYDMEITTMYVDQFPANDMSRDLAKKYQFSIVDSIEKALLDPRGKLGVDGVIIVGEHGKYPKNDRGQILYPRRKFFEEIVKVFAKTGTVVPVFNDKHLSARWIDAFWMYEQAKKLKIPMFAGSSLPVTWRKPDLELPIGAEITEAVQLGYGPLEGYGFHALESLQCMVERRKGGETGVSAVTALQGAAIWQALDHGAFSKSLLEKALGVVPAHARGDIRQITSKARDAAVYLIDYRDGFQAAVAMLNGYLYEGDGGAFCFATQQKGSKEPVATHFYLQQPDPFAHFAQLVTAIEFMMKTGKPPYPLERTLLTTGMLDAAISSQNTGKRVETPELKIAYQPTQWKHATGVIPKSIKR